MKVRHVCAILGIALAAGIVLFTESLVATNDRQSIAFAEKLIEEVPVNKDALVAHLSLDYRPNGRVMQGPPMRAIVATEKAMTGDDGIIVTESLFAQRKLPVPPVGTELTLLGRNGAYRLRIKKVISQARPCGRGTAYPNAFVSPAAAELIAERWEEFKNPVPEEIAPSFMSDANRNFDRAKVLLIWAAVLTGLCLLWNALLLSVEASRRDFALLRVLGLTRFGVLKLVAKESVLMAFAGLLLAIAGSFVSLKAFVAFSPAMFPMGCAFSWKVFFLLFAATPVLAVAATLPVLRAALNVRPLDAANAQMPRNKTIGILISLSVGFGAFVAVEVWGASLMKAFVPSAEWPDAIVSILPGGVSSFDIEKLSAIDGVEKIAELQPLQVNLLPLEELKERGGGGRVENRKSYRNALLLASDWMPDFKFVSGGKETLQDGDNCIITEMMARARGWKLGDVVRLDCSQNLEMSLKIVGIVDLNWHMVTSRGLVRGLNRMPVNTDGPLFVSFDTLDACYSRPQHFVPMTHLWLDYKKDFLSKHGVFEAGRLTERSIVEALNGAELITEDNEIRGNAVRLHSRDEIADGTLSHGAQLIGDMARVPFLFVVVISLGFITMLVTSFESRKREFLVLRAIGATRFQLSAALLKEAFAVGLNGIVFGIAGGAVVGWLFTFSTRRMMANWGLPPSFEIPVSPIAIGICGTFACVLCVALPTVLVLLEKRKDTIS